MCCLSGDILLEVELNHVSIMPRDFKLATYQLFLKERLERFQWLEVEHLTLLA